MGNLQATAIPTTFFTETAVFIPFGAAEQLPEPAGPPGLSSNGPPGLSSESELSVPAQGLSSRKEATSYFKLSLALQRRQPTFKSMRAFLRSKRIEGDSPPTLAQAREAFPGASPFLVEHMFNDILLGLPLEEWCEALLNDDIPEIDIEEDPLPIESVPRRLPEDLTIRARQLWAENRRADLADLTHHYSKLDRDHCGRRPKPLMEQTPLKSTVRGYNVAIRRGDVCLVLKYLEELQRWSKQQYRYEAVQRGELLATGEDTDLEHQYQRLPLQHQWLSQQNFSIASLEDATWIHDSLEVIKKLRDAVVRHLETVDEWQNTLDEMYIGAACALLERGSILKHLLEKRQRLCGKQGTADVTLKNDRHFVLRVLSLASLLRLTEDWHYTEHPGEKRLACVSNLGCANIRSMGRFVDEEREFTKLPLISHVCAMCGHLLHPKTTYTHLEKDMGRTGKACQVRFKPIADGWNAMPLFLLLWSKRKLASSLKSVFSFDEATNTLRLKNGVASAPWLHYTTSRTNTPELCMEEPWWYCNTCHKYWLPPKQAGVCFSAVMFSCLVSRCLVLHCMALSGFILLCLFLSCLVLTSLVFSCLTLSFHVLFCILCLCPTLPVSACVYLCLPVPGES